VIDNLLLIDQPIEALPQLADVARHVVEAQPRGENWEYFFCALYPLPRQFVWTVLLSRRIESGMEELKAVMVQWDADMRQYYIVKPFDSQYWPANEIEGIEEHGAE